MLKYDYIFMAYSFVFLVLIYPGFKSKQAIPGKSPKPGLIIFPITSIYLGYQFFILFGSGPFEIVQFNMNSGPKNIHAISAYIFLIVTFVLCWNSTWACWREMKQREKWMFLDKGGWFR